MMNPSARMFALRAAAKVAFAGTVLGCGTSQPAHTQTPGESPSTTPSAATSDTTASTATTATTSDPPASNTCTIQDEKTPTDADVTCCTAVVHAGAANKAKLTTAAQLQCCNVLATHSDQVATKSGSMSTAMPERGACCTALNWQGSMTCTPWGPPAPPAFIAA